MGQLLSAEGSSPNNTVMSSLSVSPLISRSFHGISFHVFFCLSYFHSAFHFKIFNILHWVVLILSLLMAKSSQSVCCLTSLVLTKLSVYFSCVRSLVIVRKGINYMSLSPPLLTLPIKLAFDPMHCKDSYPLSVLPVPR